MVKMGQGGNDGGSRVIVSDLCNIGFDVNVGPLFSTLGQVADLAADSDLHVIGVSSQAAINLSLLPALRYELRMRRRRRIRGGRTRVRGRRLRVREGQRYVGGCGVDHTNLVSQFSPGKRGERRQ